MCPEIFWELEKKAKIWVEITTFQLQFLTSDTVCESLWFDFLAWWQRSAGLRFP